MKFKYGMSRHFAISFFALLLAILPASISFACLSFSPAANFSAGGNFPYSVAIGDLNGDTKPDLAVANYNSNTVSIFLGNGDGTFTAATGSPFSVGTNPVSVAIGDLNGDTYPDLAVANYGDNNVSVLLGDGSGSFGPATNFSVGSGPYSVAIGNLDAGSIPDLAVANYGSNNVSILIGVGNGTFGAATNISAGSGPVYAAIGDLDGDTKPDLAVANYGGNNVSILLGDGSGSFSPASPATVAVGTGPYAVGIGDLDGDTKQDLAVANGGSNNVSILIGNGDGTFGPATNHPVGTTPTSLAIGDLDGDGNLDLATANYGATTVSVLKGNGSGGFAAAMNLAAGTGPASVAIGNLNGDTKPDLVAVNHTSNDVSILLNNTPDPTDLVVSAISTSSTLLAPKQGFSLNNSVKNQGAFLACRFQVAFVLSPTTNYDDPGAIAISGTRTVSSLAAGNTSSATTSLTVPSATPPGNYHVCAKADSTNNDLETNENNNTLCTVSTIQVSEPDLHMTSVNPNSSTANQGGTLSVSDTVENQGVVAAGSFRIGYHLSKDTVFGGDDIVISTTRTVTALVAGASNTATTSLSIPSNAPGGTYYLCAMADSVNQVAETDETNNSLCSGATVTLPSADLVMTALSTATTVIAPGKTLPVSNSVKNQGGFSAGSFAIGFYLSVNADGSTQNVAITATRTLSALAAGATSTASTTLTIPAATPFGTYYVCAVADSGHTVAESDEGNNTLCTGSTIQVTLPDLSMTDVTPNAATAVKGGTLSVTTTVSNGGAASGAFRIGFYLSVNADGSTQDVAITAIRSVGSLGAGASSTGTTSLTIPGATPSLSYYVCAIADSLNQVVETDEGNNTLCSGSQVNVQ